MTDFNRGIMKFRGADNPSLVLFSALLILGSIALLISWGLKVAYNF
jgi:hypothetical protein